MKDQAAELAEEAVCLLMRAGCFHPFTKIDEIGRFKDEYATKVREELNEQAKPPSRLVDDVIRLSRECADLSASNHELRLKNTRQTDQFKHFEAAIAALEADNKRLRTLDNAKDELVRKSTERNQNQKEKIEDLEARHDRQSKTIRDFYATFNQIKALLP